MANNIKIESSIIKKLHSLKTAIRMRIAVEGLAWIVIGLVCLIVGTMLLDFTLRLELELRVFFLSLFGLGLLAILIRTIILPMFVDMDDENLALLVEKRNPILEDRLISSLQFSKSADQIDKGISPELIDKVNKQTEEIASKIDFKAFIEKTQALKIWALSFVLILMVGAFTYARADIMELWFQRNILLKNVDWPQQTYLGLYYVDRTGKLKPLLQLNNKGDIVKSVKKIPVLRGDSLKIVAVNLASSKAPKKVKCWIDYPSSGRAEATAKSPSKKKLPKYALALAGVLRNEKDPKFFEIKFNNVREEFEFYVYGGDDSRDSRNVHKISLVESPRLKDLKIVETFHPYLNKTGIEKSDVHNPSKDVISVRIGSELQFEGVATKDLSKAWLEVDGVKAGKVEIEPVSIDGKKMPRRYVGKVRLDENQIFQIEEDGAREIKEGITIKLKLVDTDDFVNKRGEKFEFELKPDLPGDIEIEKKYVRDLVCPQVTIPLEIKAKDDIGIDNVKIYCKVIKPQAGKDGKNLSTKWIEVTEKLTMADKDAKDDAYQLSAKRKFDMLQLMKRNKKIPVLKPGMVLQFKAVMEDTLLSSFGGPNVSDSNILEFKIVSRDYLYSIILGRQSEFSVEFKQTLITQATVNGKIIHAYDLISSGKNIDSAKQKIMEAIRGQAEVKNACADLAVKYSDLVQEMELNKVGKKEQLEKIRTQIITELEKVPAKVEEIKKRAQLAYDSSSRPQAVSNLLSANDLQKDLLSLLNQIFSNMEQCTSLIQFQQSLEALIGTSKEFGVEIDDTGNAETDTLFEEDEEAEEAEKAATQAEKAAKQARKLAAQSAVQADILAKKASKTKKPEDKKAAEDAQENARRLAKKAEIAEIKAKKARKKANEF